MSDLTEFLLARIAEDEAAANNWSRFEIRDGIPGNYAIPDRVLAECEAKRQVIDAAWGDHLRIEGEWGKGRGQEALEAVSDYPDALVALVTIYADHPDYRKEWRL